MPSVVQPSGGGGKIRVRYTVCRKHGLIATSKRLVAEGMTLPKAAKELRLGHSNLVKWTAKGISNIDFLDKILLKSKKKATHKGWLCKLKSLEYALLCYIFELREQGVTVNTFIVVLRASFLSPKFRVKSFTARCSPVKCFCIAHSFAY